MGETQGAASASPYTQLPLFIWCRHCGRYLTPETVADPDLGYCSSCERAAVIDRALSRMD